jgi:hypothetical protein
MSNVDMDHSCTKDGLSIGGLSIGVPTRDSNAACSKRLVAEGKLSRQKHRCPVELSMSVPTEVLIPYNPSEHVISQDFHHTNNYYSLKGEGSKKHKLEDASPAEGQFFFGDASQVRQKHSSVEGFEKKGLIL